MLQGPNQSSCFRFGPLQTTHIHTQTGVCRRIETRMQPPSFLTDVSNNTHTRAHTRTPTNEVVICFCILSLRPIMRTRWIGVFPYYCQSYSICVQFSQPKLHRSFSIAHSTLRASRNIEFVPHQLVFRRYSAVRLPVRPLAPMPLFPPLWVKSVFISSAPLGSPFSGGYPRIIIQLRSVLPAPLCFCLRCCSTCFALSFISVPPVH